MPNLKISELPVGGAGLTSDIVPIVRSGSNFSLLLLDLPVSSSVQAALDLKAPLESPTFTGTVSGVTAAHVGLGNVSNTSDANKPVSIFQQAALDLKANLASPTFTGTVGGITRAMVGLGNVDNTSDANKPVSTAQQTALNLKGSLAATNVWTRSQIVDMITLTDAANIAWDSALSNTARVTLAGNRTLDNPTNLSDGWTFWLKIKQDATGGRTLAYGTKFKFVGSSTLSVAANAIDVLRGVYDSTDDILLCVLDKNFV